MILDLSRGHEPIKASYDALYSQWLFRVDGKSIAFDCARMPFTIIDIRDKGACADKALILKHIGRAAKLYQGGLAEANG